MSKLSDEDAGNNESNGFRPTLPDNLVTKEISTLQPFIPTFVPLETIDDHDDDITEQPDRDGTDSQELEELERTQIQETTTEPFSTISTEQPKPTTSRGPQSPPGSFRSSVSRDKVRRPVSFNRASARESSFHRQRTQEPALRRPLSRNPLTARSKPRAQTTTRQPVEEPRRDEPRKLDGFPINILDDFEEIKEVKLVEDADRLSPEQALFHNVQESLEPIVPVVPNSNSRSRSRSRVPQRTHLTTEQDHPDPLTLRLPTRQEQPNTPVRVIQSQPQQVIEPVQPRPAIKRRPEPVQPFAKIPHQPGSLAAEPVLIDTPESSEFEYEYYYDYLDVEDSSHRADYDLVPLSNKVRIMADGIPHCLDVGVFPHPFNCKQFVNCFRNPGTGIIGSIYKCPSYLAFDPVGGRCNWVSEIVCEAKK